MSATDYQGTAASSFANFGRSILSIRRDQIPSVVDSTEGTSQELEFFQKNVLDKFRSLLNVSNSELLSIPWIGKLLELFISCQGEFRGILSDNKSQINRTPLDRYVTEHFERSVKALDVCNAIRDGIEQVRQWKKQLEIVLCALDNNPRNIGEGQFLRAKKAINDLAIAMLDDNKDHNTPVSHRNRSFGRNTTQKDHKPLAHSRSLSWSVSRSWSATRQLQAIGNNLTPPRVNEIAATNGLSMVVFTMNYVLLFVMWALVAAIPCQDRGLQVHFYPPRQYIWAAPMSSLHDRIMDEYKKRDKRNACGLLKEIQDIENCTRHINYMSDSLQFPLTEEKDKEVRERVHDLRLVYNSIKNGLDPLEVQVREVFHKIVRSRTEGLDCIGRANSR